MPRHAWLVSRAVRRGGTAAAQQQQREDVARQPMLESEIRLQATLARSRRARQRRPCRSQPWYTANETCLRWARLEEPPAALTRVAGFTTLPVHPLARLWLFYLIRSSMRCIVYACACTAVLL